MEERRTYIEPTIESVSISATESACKPEGSVPPQTCGAVAPTFEMDPMGSMS